MPLVCATATASWRSSYKYHFEYRVPTGGKSEIGSLRLHKPNPISEAEAVPQGVKQITVRKGVDPADFEGVTEDIAELFRFNPRRLKQFVNVFRLQLMVAVATGVLAPVQGASTGQISTNLITMEKIGLFTAILLRWPQITTDLIENPTLLDELIVDEQSRERPLGKWSKESELINILKGGGPYSLSGVNLRPLLTTMPDAYPGLLDDRSASQERTRLVGRPYGPSGEASNNPVSSSNTASMTVPVSGVAAVLTTGPTGPTRPTSSTATSTRPGGGEGFTIGPGPGRR